MEFDFKRMFKYERNVGDRDRQIRYGVGALSVLISLFLGSIPLLLLGIALLVSGFTRFCPIYAGMGRSTLPPCCAGKMKEKESHGCCGGEEKKAEAGEHACCGGENHGHAH
ncbi:hypothetical protein MIT9_P0240 [Methylomarinovum caldicuralii]|uniref:Inner membrane protein YgaP-like transmembrane domain-containing protein n=1 Tax=Methylomarinovum caldicuralii TaxID=438856 RepID=A0AAU9BQF6_9GAMM|nr:DUF2892 domain-containing protein [Methylomarinovum caldicuralii]BCX80666.1 hypothetical protein MIT9_P0240 [Methylomarinovum caldicuralii]